MERETKAKTKKAENNSKIKNDKTATKREKLTNFPFFFYFLEH